jgi:hypothetical protein
VLAIQSSFDPLPDAFAEVGELVALGLPLDEQFGLHLVVPDQLEGLLVVDVHHEVLCEGRHASQTHRNLPQNLYLELAAVASQREGEIADKIDVLPVGSLGAVELQSLFLEVLRVLAFKPRNAADPEEEVVLKGIYCDKRGKVDQQDKYLLLQVPFSEGLQREKDEVNGLVGEISLELSNRVANVAVNPQILLILIPSAEGTGSHEQVNIAKLNQTEMLSLKSDG